MAIFKTIAVFAAMVAPAYAQSEPQCSGHDDVTANLASKYGETVVATGVTLDDRLIEVFASENGATFTIVITFPYSKNLQLISCGVAAGKDWEVREWTPPEPVKSRL